MSTETSSRLGGRILAWALAVSLIVVVGSVALWVADQRQEAPAADDSVVMPGTDESDLTSEPPSAPEAPEAAADRESATAPDPGPPTDSFRQGTGTVLLFDDGGDGALAVDLDSWERKPVALPGQRPGDQPFRLWQMGSWVVVGWEQIWAVAPGDPESARRLGDATVFLPHAEPDALWLVDYAGGRVGTGDSTWTLIDPSGAELAVVESAPAGLIPVRGVPGGLAVASPNGTHLVYDLEQERLVDNPVGGTARLGDVTRDRVAWCVGDPCDQVFITDGEGELVATLGAGETFAPNQVWLSPSGAHLAAGVRVQAGRGVDLRLHIYRTDDGELLAAAQLMLGWVFGDWTVDGRQFFAWNHLPDPAAAPGTLYRWAGASRVEQVALGQHDIRDVYRFVAIPSSWVEEVFVSAPPARAQ